ncbi:MAG: sulfotransferase [Proteobacteria bacterium]|nr:sulfotransferase [Pseudomonadota bacterium]MBU4295737.1 sulfotransferase [Pseudomonadota bacterium]MCG2747156.1 sulfotransferase [Desulfobulbaceae bacterium]
MSDLRPIIIGGFYRCGTTLLRRLLDSHSQIHCPPEIKFFRDLRLEFQDDPYAHLRFFTTVRSLPASTEDLLDTIGQGYLALRQRIADRLGKPIWADKDPENALYLEQWRMLLPAGFRYIHMARYPLDMLASAREAGFVKSLPSEPEAVLDRWLTNCRAARHHMEQWPDDSLLLRYDDLVRAPVETLQHLFSWLELPFEPEILDLFADPARGTGIEDQKTLQFSSIHGASVGRGAREFRPDEARRLLTCCQPELKWSGY